MKKFSDYVNENKLVNELENLKKEYQEVFNALLDKYGVDSPAELSSDKKSEFFDEISKYYKSGSGKTDKGDELTEGNEFSEQRQKAIDNGDDEFEVDGKKYKVKGDTDGPSLD